MRVVATAGHVDHGKSALLERLTGMQPDRWEQERRRGLSIDLGYVWTDLEGPDGPVTVAFVDVPGHDQFIPNMLSGVGVVDRVLFVVAADDGWSAQSEEHLQILDLLGLDGALVVVTKADLAGEARTTEVLDAVAGRLAGTRLAEAPIVVADSVTGRGLEEVADVLARRLAAPTAGGGEEGDARLWIDRSFTAPGAGTVVTGMLESGTLERQQRVTVLPGEVAGRVRGLQSLGAEVETAAAGARVAVNLGGVDHGSVGRGMVLVATDAAGRPRGLASHRLDVELTALGHADIGARGAWRLHLGTASRTVRIRPLLGDVPAGGTGFAQLELDASLPVRHGDRFVLRDAGRATTAGGGVVLDPEPVGRARGTEARLAHGLELEALADAADDAAGVLGGLVDAHGGVRGRDRLRAAVGRPVGAAVGLDELAGHLVRPNRLEAWTRAVTDAAAAGPAEHAVAASELTAAAEAHGCPAGLVGAVLDAAVASGTLASHGGRYVHHGHEATYLDARARRRARLLQLLEAEPLNPPDPTQAASDAGLASFELRAMVDDEELVACGPLLFTAPAVAQATDRLRDGPGRDGAAFTASDAKQAWGTTRRAALPLLEHLRATRVTAFDGTHHRLR